tara:strand:+ start:9407 stop:9565 length:159 start_codon:yes stop_codon:yes gene_type:complete
MNEFARQTASTEATTEGQRLPFDAPDWGGDYHRDVGFGNSLDDHQICGGANP